MIRRNHRRGFTLIELLVVIAIIGILSSVAIVSLNSVRARARDTQRLADMKAVQQALELYSIDNNGYPQKTINDCGSSTTWDEFIKNDLGKYLTSVPHEPRRPRVAPWCYYYTAPVVNVNSSLCTAIPPPPKNHAKYVLVFSTEQIKNFQLPLSPNLMGAAWRYCLTVL